MNYTVAKGIADQVVAALAPACVRIEIAGSVRRHKPADIHDIEIVCIAKPPVTPPFGQAPTLSPLHELTDSLRAQGVMVPREDSRGRRAWGPKMRRTTWHETKLDLFIVTAETWGVQLMIRTGDADFSRLMVSGTGLGGALPNTWNVENGRIWDGDTPLCTPEEADVFYLLNLPHLDPRDRNEQMLRRLIRERAKA